MTTNDPIRDRIEAAERMLHHARQEHTRGSAEDCAECLAAARRNIDRAAEALQNTAKVDYLMSPREKGRIEAAHRRQEVSNAR